MRLTDRQRRERAHRLENLRGIARRREAIDREAEDAAIDAVASGVSIRQAAGALGIDRDTLRRRQPELSVLANRRAACRGR